MATFFVGQRVRIVRVKHATEALGRSGVITGYSDFVADDDGELYSGWDVDVDGLGGTSQRNGFEYCFPGDYLEPIVPSGHTPGIYSFQELMDKCREGVVV